MFFFSRILPKSLGGIDNTHLVRDGEVVEDKGQGSGTWRGGEKNFLELVEQEDVTPHLSLILLRILLLAMAMGQWLHCHLSITYALLYFLPSPPLRSLLFLSNLVCPLLPSLVFSYQSALILPFLQS